jgi:ABC-2 type transport system ATP-binding protein
MIGGIVMNVIEIRKLTKSYGRHKALEGVDLTVKQGEVYGFIGPNGAGKTTTIRILLGMLKKDGGEVKIFDKDPWDNAVELHKKIAYIPGDVNLWPNLTGGQVIDFLGRLNGEIDLNLKEELLEKFQLKALYTSLIYYDVFQSCSLPIFHVSSIIHLCQHRKTE